MADDLEVQPPPLQPAHRRQVSLLSGLMHAGLVLIAASAVFTLQPAMMPRDWAPYVVVALAMIVCAAATRGRCGFRDGGKLLTALGVALVFHLAREPQLANVPAIGEAMPAWLMTIAPGLGTVGLLLAVIAGFVYLRTLSNYLGHGHRPPFLTALNWTSVLVLVLALVTFTLLRRFYEMDVTYLSLLLASIVQYYLLVRVTLEASGRVGVGSAPMIVLAVAILLALGRNVMGGVMTGGEGP